MAEDDKNAGAWSRVPVWDGDPKTWRSFRKEMTWWLEALDVQSTKKYNLAARWLLRQSGIVRQRGEEFTPAELAFQPAIMAKDPETGDDIELTPEDPLAGINKLLRALETINGKTQLDKRGDLRNSFYLELKRKPQERISEFCTRFRSAVAELRMEGVTLPTAELGWFLKQKLGLDALRQQLLETALQGKESYEETEVEVLRLFRDLHSADPLAKKTFHGGDQQPRGPPLMQRFLAQQRAPSSRAPSSSAPSVSSFASGRSSSTYASSRPFQKRSPSQHRQAFVADTHEEEELVPDEPELEENGESPNLEEVLQAEAEILATELEEAVEEGVEAALVQDVEETVESAAEALLTMREARQKLAEVKKDRGYGKASPAADPKSKVGAKKASGKHPCFDCGLPGHWAGDAECTKPGAGLGRKGPPPKKPMKAVKVVETLNTEHVVDELPPEDGPHEAFAVTCVRRNRSLGEVLNSNQSQPPREVHAVGTLSHDKRLVGALDSACNRTVTGPQWLITYMEALRAAPEEIWSLVKSAPENEVFRFGDGGTQVSTERWRLPMVIGDTLLVFWTSVVPVPSLGLLLGRDYLESVGATMSFSRRLIKFDFLNTSAIPLKQLAAGHFLLRLIPRQWPGVGTQKWRRVGTDGIIELQVTLREWLTRRLKASDPLHEALVHEHLLSERSLQAGLFAQEIIEKYEAAQSMSVQAGPHVTTSSPTTTRTPSSLANECLAADGLVGRHLLPQKRAAPALKGSKSCHKMDAPRATFRGSAKLAFAWAVVMACAAASSSLCPTAVPGYQFVGPLEASGTRNGEASPHASRHLPESHDFGTLQHGRYAGVHVASQPDGLAGRLRGRSYFDGNVGGSLIEGLGSTGQARSFEGGKGKGQAGRKGWHPRGGSSSVDWTSRWTADSSRRSVALGCTAQCACRGQHDRGPDQRESETHGGALEVQAGFQELQQGLEFKSGLCQADSYKQSSSCQSTSYHDVLNVSASGRDAARTSPESGSICRDDATSRWRARSAVQAGRTEQPTSDCRRTARALLTVRGHSHADRQHPQRGDGSHDGRVHGGRASSVGRRVHGECLPRPAGRPVWRPGIRRPREGGGGESSRCLEFDLHQDLKKGQATLIANAWEKHMADCKKISLGQDQVRQALVTEFEEEMSHYMNDEIFMNSVDLASCFTPSTSKPPSFSNRTSSSLLRPSRQKSPLKLKRPLSQQSPSKRTTPKSNEGTFMTEIFTTTQRVMKEAAKRGHRVGVPMSLETGWNFLQEEDRRACMAWVKKEKPFFLTIAFPCGPFSPLQRLNQGKMSPEVLERGRILMSFALELAEEQLRGGRHYALENPAPSGAWREPLMEEFIDRHDPFLVDFDQCQLGLRSLQGNFHKKPTRLASSSSTVTSLMDGRRCTRSHIHDPVIGGSKVTVRAGHYPAAMARLLVRGMEDQFNLDAKKFTAQNSSEVLAVGNNMEDELEGEHFAPPTLDSDSDLETKEASGNPEKIPAAIKAAVARLHANTGHRSNKRLARSLTIAGAPAMVIRAAKEHQCSICKERAPQKPQRPASLPQPRDVSDQVHVDILEAFDVDGTKYYIIHCIDFCTRFQMSQVLERKSAEDVIAFMKTRWMPVFGPMRVLVCDQAREFISHKFQDYCSENSVLLWHFGVGAPWQNGIAERSGGTLKAILNAVVMANSVQGRVEMEAALGEATAAYNQDVNDSGVSPAQAALGRQPKIPGDTLTDVQSRLAEHDLVDKNPDYARLMALRETAKVSMTRLHFSRGLRKAELARSRDTTITNAPTPGSIVYFFRFQKYNSRSTGRRHRLALRRWHGPGLLVAIENGSNGQGANCYISFKGQLTKCSMEHVRLASPMEQIASDTWRDAIEEAVESALHDMTRSGVAISKPSPSSRTSSSTGTSLAPSYAPSEAEEERVPADLPPVEPQEMVGAMQAGLEPSLPSVVGQSRQTTPFTRQNTPVPTTAPSRTVNSQSPFPLLEQQLARARLLRPLSPTTEHTEHSSSSVKRGPEIDAERLRAESEAASQAEPPPSELNDTLVVSKHEILSVLNNHAEDVHPLMKIYSEACVDRANPLDAQVRDHGTWRGSWGMPSPSEWKARQSLGLTWPCGVDDINDVNAVQTARREYHWSSMSPKQKEGYKKAAEAGWAVWTNNDAVEVLSEAESLKIRQELKRRGEEGKILTPRWVFTDKHDGLRTESNNLEEKPNARLVVPGFKDVFAFSIRKDAPTASRTSQHMVLTLTACNFAKKSWRLLSVDIKSAFMKGDPYMSGTRELFIQNIRIRGDEPGLPLSANGLARVRKGVFGLADAPRQWYLRLNRALTERGWERSTVDAACWFLWSDDRATLLGVVLSHVDDLLCGGGEEARKSILSLETELGFGSIEHNAFNYCGKNISQDLTTGVITVSMEEYHSNLKTVVIPTHRRGDPAAALTPAEQKQLRGLLGSLQWLVAQVRVDHGYALSVLQGETPNMGALMKANALAKRMKASGSFSLKFKPMELDGAGVMVVTDSSLGNVAKNGGADAPMKEKTYSQSSFFVLLADKALMGGKEGSFCLLDARSHRLPKVCRSTFGAELLGAEEAFDVGQYVRGVMADFLGYPMENRHVDAILDAVPLTVVTDAKDTFDKCSSDTPSFGSQKSLAFTTTWIRSILRRPNTSLRWSATENMFVDAGAKEMDLSHLQSILTKGRWNACYSASFIKKPNKGGRKSSQLSADAAVPGESLDTSHDVFPYLRRLSEASGWHFEKDVAMQVARNAKSFRSPEPRLDPKKYPLRSSYGRFDHTSGFSEWKILEDRVPYKELGNSQAPIGVACAVLISIFAPMPPPTKEKRQL